MVAREAADAEEGGEQIFERGLGHQLGEFVEAGEHSVDIDVVAPVGSDQGAGLVEGEGFPPEHVGEPLRQLHVGSP